MKTAKYIFKLVVILLFVFSNKIISQTQTCDNFNISTGSWQTVNATALSSRVNMTADGTNYLRIGDQPSTNGSWVFNTSYNATLVNDCNASICYDYKIFNDGINNTVSQIKPSIRIYSGTITNPTAIAVFVADNVTVTENGNWVHLCIPLEKATTTLPGNSQGSWRMSANSTIADWNNLIDNFNGVAFSPEFSNLQTEVIGVDNFCLNSGENTPVASFYFTDIDGTIKDTFCEGEGIFLNGIDSQNEDRYFIDAWSRPLGSTGSFQYVSGLGWTSGELSTILNISNLFGPTTFQEGNEYEIKLAVGNECNGWVPLTKRFKVLSNSLNSDFSFQSFCDADGTITVTTNALNTNGSHWWRIFETQTPASISSADTIGSLGGIQSGTTVTFTGLSAYKNYYIKHGVWNDCVSWQETRKALPSPINWPGRTSNFAITSMTYSGGIASITVQADTNPVYVNQWWAVFEEGTNNQVTPIQCCNQDNLTINFNAQLHKKYYVKHGIWNDCMGWKESRTAFWFGQTPTSEGERPQYFSEVVELNFIGSEAHIEEMNYLITTGGIFEDDLMLRDTIVIDDHLLRSKTPTDSKVVIGQIEVYPNPMRKGQKLTVVVPSDIAIQEINLITLRGKVKPIKYRENQGRVEIPIGLNVSNGMYFLQIIKKSGESVVKKIAIQ